ncbi:MAG TPA: ATP-binding protein, partial [Longimicrobiaceae bacterium]
IKFTPEGGSVGVRADLLTDCVLFAVKDTGVGIPEQDVPHLFERFWQVRHAGRAGAGLGLAIARGLVELQGGRIWLQSEPGRGSTFAFTIPVHRVDAC